MALTPVHELMFDTAFPFLGGKFKDYFMSLGSWDLTAGDAQQGFLGSRFVNVLGMDLRLVFSPFGWLLGPGRRNPFTDIVMGLGDDVSFTYGGRTTATYGGPATNIVRGYRINKFGGANLDILGAPNVPHIPTPLDFINGPDAPEDREAANRSAVAKNMAATDDTAFIAVAALGVCLTLITNILEIVAHAKFGQYDKATGHATIVADDRASGATIQSGDQVTINTASFNATSDISSGFRDIREAHRWLPRRLMAIIYHIEMAGTLSGYMYNLADGLKRITIKIAKILVYCIPPAGLFLWEHEENRLARSVKTLSFWIKVILAIIFLVIVILMFVGVM
jgi:hypothetical protein